MAKYIDTEKLKADIERLKNYAECSKNEWINEGYNQNAFAEDCRIDSFDKLLSFIDSLHQEQASLPDNLDEAANDYGVNIRKGYPRVMDETDKYIYNAFKAGAEWMAGQGVTVNGSIEEISDGTYKTVDIFAQELDDVWTDGDCEVIIQIRKK